MRSILLMVMPILSLFTAVILQGYGSVLNSKVASPKMPSLIKPDTTDFDQEKALSDLRSHIKGRENEPAGKVFENIKKFERLPAGRLLNVMEKGFSRSLGVNCTHCHNPNNWGSEEKPQKQIAREMMGIVATVNTELLARIEDLDSEKPTVNCTTCHRGQIKPALNLEN